jgi:hypothetical protein
MRNRRMYRIPTSPKLWAGPLIAASVLLFDPNVVSAHDGLVCQGPAAPGCSWIWHDTTYVQGLSNATDATGGTNYDVKTENLVLQRATSTGWTSVHTVSDTDGWWLDLDNAGTAYLGIQHGNTYRAISTRSWRTSGVGTSEIVFGSAIVID